jgi:two-component system cell cycle response regulator
MIRLANVLVIDSGRPLAGTLAAVLTAAGYSVTEPPAGSDPAARVAAEHPDLVLIGDDGDASIALAGALRGDAATDDIPLLMVTDRLTAALTSRAYEAGFDDVIPAGCEESELLARMRPLVRLATMHAELSHRAAVARRFDVAARDRVAAAEAAAHPAILVAGDAPELVETVLAADAELVLCANLYEAETLLTTRNFDAAVVAFAGGAEDVLGFCTQVRHNPRLFNLPIVLVQVDGVSVAEAYRRGASRVLAHPVDAEVLRAAVLTLVHRQQLRWSIRSATGESLAAATRDAETGAYAPPFLESYLQDRLAFAIASHRHLAVVVFDAPNIDGVRQQFGDDAASHLTLQLGQWITGLLRAEDLVARTGRHEFCVVLPDTPLAEAEVVMHRIAGVLAYTDFAVREVYQPVKVWVQVGATNARDGDDIARLLGRARRHIE